MRQPNLYSCDFPSCPQDEMTDADVTHVHIRLNSPANPGNEVAEFDLCSEHTEKFNKFVDDYR